MLLLIRGLARRVVLCIIRTANANLLDGHWVAFLLLFGRGACFNTIHPYSTYIVFLNTYMQSCHSHEFFSFLLFLLFFAQ